ncbi:hypothetical protein [Paenibacillus cremeus]|uniref:AP2 domain-containing protein n=1 Tax=Paenibacillus cremeus TaxID=2163881 RepID=A0A559KCM3_9BACL|nr:hypothetical protein [Paenibacillus cremeus]TVY09882.1 hypothetical protein FPZ49_10950 [Paenibacillus cremeus]
MATVDDLTGRKFGRWTVLKRVENNKVGRAMWLCECSCDSKTQKPLSSSVLKTGDSTSCGCFQKELASNVNRKYDIRLQSKRIYTIWNDMNRRCFNENCREFKWYGEKGITVCDDWSDENNGFPNFFKWSMENGYSENLTIDRIESDGNYEPSNCRWATKIVQANNKNNTIYVKINNVTKTVGEWSQESGIASGVIRSRLRSGWQNEDLLKHVKVKVSND